MVGLATSWQLLGALWTADIGDSFAAHKIDRFQMTANAYSEHL